MKFAFSLTEHSEDDEWLIKSAYIRGLDAALAFRAKEVSVVAEGLSWQEWRSGGSELLLLRDYAPSVPEHILGAAWRMLEAAGDDAVGRADVLTLLDGHEALAKATKEAEGC